MVLNWKKWISLVMVLVGNMLYALSVKLFVLPANLMSCGTTGIALVVRELTGLPISGFVLGFNLVMLALGWWVLGRQFAMTTVLSSLLYPLLLELLNQTLGEVLVTRNMILNVVFAGLGLGLSLGIADRVGSLEVGKDGDVVIWTADPLTTIGGEAYVTVVDGKVVYSAEEA